MRSEAPFGAYPSAPRANHGNGFLGTGILAPGAPLPSSAKITFATPGIYAFECVVHAHMDGKIIVTK